MEAISQGGYAAQPQESSRQKDSGMPLQNDTETPSLAAAGTETTRATDPGISPGIDFMRRFLRSVFSRQKDSGMPLQNDTETPSLAATGTETTQATDPGISPGIDFMRRFLSDLQSANVIVRVGKDEEAQDFEVPRRFLARSSDWFSKILEENRFKEGRDGKIEMPEDFPAVFEAFLFWIHRQGLVFDFDACQSVEARSHQLILYFRIWTFGDKYFVHPLQNCAMHIICVLLNEDLWKKNDRLTAATLAACWDATIPDSPLRALLADGIVSRMQEDESYEVEELEGCAGLLRALHASEAILHESHKADFPRYKKPTLFKELLYAKLGDEGDVDESKWLYRDDWDEPNGICEDCGYENDVALLCDGCKRWDEDCDCDGGSYKYFCEDCDYT
ncbi:hypothetical protein AC578_3082 [Pseudocercospora eumusae]|uniref:BTB domain-containing protein n=1 Tax=Pseudocercospora eumusae TaxID=321146 RepID=A0A139H1W1_9PEZI|nr:hypothetical protein AC578_3082 [Pseudocercospora eumusae]